MNESAVAGLAPWLKSYHWADIQFFRRRPDRRHRIRLAGRGEVVQARHCEGITAPLPEGIRFFVAVSFYPELEHEADNGWRRVIGFADEDTDTDLSEKDAQAAFEHFADHDDATLRRLAGRGGRAA